MMVSIVSEATAGGAVWQRNYRNRLVTAIHGNVEGGEAEFPQGGLGRVDRRNAMLSREGQDGRIRCLPLKEASVLSPDCHATKHLLDRFLPT